MTAATIHGTTAGWGKHRRTGTPPCEPCKVAQAAYQAAWLAASAAGRERGRWAARTRQRALQRLAGEFPARFAELVAAERAGGPGE